VELAELEPDPADQLVEAEPPVELLEVTFVTVEGPADAFLEG